MLVMKKQARIQFILKERHAYGSNNKSYGLLNSCLFIVNALKDNGIDAEAIQVVDNNQIDREVTRFKPTHCFIEAIWVIPEKFVVLSKLHPDINWIIRLHSQVPFLSSEGVALQWLKEYQKLNKQGIKLFISCNNLDAARDLSIVFPDIMYHPNIYYPLVEAPKRSHMGSRHDLHIGCFGAIRPLKNQLEQAVWAMHFAEDKKKNLSFHINKSEFEPGERDSILRNLVALFEDTNHKLVFHEWISHTEFLKLVATMDMGMQLSFSETYNIVAADFVYCNVPVIVSEQIDWINCFYKANVFDSDDVLYKLAFAYYSDIIDFQKINRKWLSLYNSKSTDIWLKWIKKINC